MTDDINTPAPEPDWAAVRLRYESGAEKVADIAADINLAGITLSRHAKKMGWAMRGAKAAAASRRGDKPADKPPDARAVSAPEARPANAATTAQTLQRLKDILTRRISHLEGDLSQIGEEVKALNNERDIRSANTLVRTLEKVLELEHRERKNRAKRARESARLNDAERDELARRIEGLCREEPGERAEPGAEDQRGAQTAVGLAPLGEG